MANGANPEDRRVLIELIEQLNGEYVDTYGPCPYIFPDIEVPYRAYNFNNACNKYDHDNMLCVCYVCYVAAVENGVCGYAMKYSNLNTPHDIYFDTFQDAIRFLSEKHLMQKTVNTNPVVFTDEEFDPLS